jgi:hypothetical protein
MSEDKAASNKVRKNDAARRILETDEGMRAIKPCRYCTRQGRDCRVFKRSTGENSKRVTCAFCKKSGSTGCDATNHPEHARTKATQKRTVPAAHQHEASQSAMLLAHGSEGSRVLLVMIRLPQTLPLHLLTILSFLPLLTLLLLATTCFQPLLPTARFVMMSCPPSLPLHLFAVLHPQRV